MQFQRGEVHNPLGRAAGSLTWQDYGPRMKTLLSDYNHSEILKYAENHKARDRDFSSWDGILILTIADAIRDSKGRAQLMDRILGKALQRVESTVNVNHSDGLKIETLDDDQLLIMADSIDALRVARALPVVEVGAGVAGTGAASVPQQKPPARED